MFFILCGFAQASCDTANYPRECDIATDIYHLLGKWASYPRQTHGGGAMQADEMLSLFALVRTSFVTRILEIGGGKGDSALNFLQALKCKKNAIVYTVDIVNVTKIEHTVPHVSILKDARRLSVNDIHRKAVDLVFLDCHAFYATQRALRNILKNNLLSRDGFVILHDTGLHTSGAPAFAPSHSQLNKNPEGFIHQPVERLIAQWIQNFDCSFQRVSLHDDKREVGPRHGLTIMQRRVNLDVNDCSSGNRKRKMFDYDPSDCESVQAESAKLHSKCPVSRNRTNFD